MWLLTRLSVILSLAIASASLEGSPELAMNFAGLVLLLLCAVT